MSSVGPGVTLSAEWLSSPVLVSVVTRIARHYGLGYPDIEDLIQETRIALWEKGLEAQINSSWINQTAIHKAVDLLRAGARRQARDGVAAALALAHGDDVEVQHLLNVKVDLLDHQLRSFYEMRYREGRSEREIVRDCGLCRASVRWLDAKLRRSVGCEARGIASETRGEHQKQFRRQSRTRTLERCHRPEAL